MIHLDQLLEADLLPDALIRLGIRRLLAATLRDHTAPGVEAQRAALLRHVADLKARGIAEQTRAANDQHYEVPTRFYQLCLGRHLKYSSGLWREGVTTLDDAEARMLALTCERADLHDGQRILELGCGWGSLTLWMAERFPNSSITAVSNSATQREHIEKQVALRGLDNVTVLTCDVNRLGAGAGEGGGPGAYAELVHEGAERLHSRRKTGQRGNRLAGGQVRIGPEHAAHGAQAHDVLSAEG